MSGYFNNAQKGELKEIKELLKQSDIEKVKEGLEQLTAYMSIGRDVSSLFMDVLKCLE